MFPCFPFRHMHHTINQYYVLLSLAVNPEYPKNPQNPALPRYFCRRIKINIHRFHSWAMFG